MAPGKDQEVEELRRKLDSVSGDAAVRTLARKAARLHRKDRTLAPLIELAHALWKGKSESGKTAALEMVSSVGRRLEEDHWPELKGWVGDVRLAKHADLLGRDVLGWLVQRDRAWLRVLKHWALSKNKWERRVAVMAVVPRARRMGDAEAAHDLCESLMGDADPDVQEAVGLLLCESFEADPGMTRDFLSRWDSRTHATLRPLLPLR
ncbi:MAG: DNA alkylation repair protein [Chloroflexota bacterium]